MEGAPAGWISAVAWEAPPAWGDASDVAVPKTGAGAPTAIPSKNRAETVRATTSMLAILGRTAGKVQFSGAPVPRTVTAVTTKVPCATAEAPVAGTLKVRNGRFPASP